MSLKDLASKVLHRDSFRTPAAAEKEELSHCPNIQERDTGTVTVIHIHDFIDATEERAAVMEHDAADCYPDRQAATAAAYEDCKIIWLERIRR